MIMGQIKANEVYIREQFATPVLSVSIDLSLIQTQQAACMQMYETSGWNWENILTQSYQELIILLGIHVVIVVDNLSRLCTKCVLHRKCI